ncbi:MAG TPA: hypothetical protein VM782_18840 [Stellaceae bacterium]|nr:hypothetical protein [Stellaceae bacterium]
MPRYVIERQYLLPMYEHIFVSAPNLEEACHRAVDEHKEPWGDHARLDFENARATTVVRIVEIPDALSPDLRAREDEHRHDLSEMLYELGLEPLPIPAEFAEEGGPSEDGVGFV